MLRQYQQRFRFILVDEYQDTNVAQYLWLRLLAQRPSAAPDTQPVTPVRREAANPGSRAEDERALWIPGSRQTARPGTT